MPPVVDASSCGCCQSGCRHLTWLLIMQPIPNCLIKLLGYSISNHPRDVAQAYRLPPQKAQQHSASMAIVKSERLLREKLRKRRTNLFKKANELARMTNSKTYIVVQHDDKYYTYKSTEESNWPPPEREIVSRLIYYGQTITEDDRGHTTTNATDVLQIFTVPNHGKLRGCAKSISLMNAELA
jgi:hypothetical protein